MEEPMKDVHLLEPGKAVEREINGGEVHSYQIQLAAGQYVHVVVDQRGIDLILILVEPDGKESPEIDSPTGWWGIEEICLIAPVAGQYVIHVRSLDKTVVPGRYEVKAEALRMATPSDERRAEAAIAYAEGERLRSEQTAESRRRAIAKYEKAASLRQNAGDSHGEAIAFLAAGETYADLGEYHRAIDYDERALGILRLIGGGELATALDFAGPPFMRTGQAQKALKYYEEALSIQRSIHDRTGEAATLTNLGLAYYTLGENKKALDYLTRALPLSRAAGDRRREADILHGMAMSWYVTGDYQKALDLLNASLPLRRAIGQRRGEGQTLNRIGVVYDALGDGEKALDYFGQALSLQRTLGDRYWEADTLTH
ncbi:MAG: tetratricopeptide repeat protein, partial [Thermoanaerobaculia bacterium]